jgi:ring-1,2-phenylacetyl-CoA epoxidase subunit PaaC
MFSRDCIDEEMTASGVGFDPATLKHTWQTYVEQVFTVATLQTPHPDIWMQKGGKQGVHTEHLSYLLAEMQVLHRAHPGAKW